MNTKLRNILIINLVIFVALFALSVVYRADSKSSKNTAPYTSDGTGYRVDINELATSVSDSDQRDAVKVVFNDYLVKYVVNPSSSYSIDLSSIRYENPDVNNKKVTTFNVTDNEKKNAYKVTIEGVTGLWNTITVTDKNTPLNSYSYTTNLRASPSYNSEN